MIGKMLENVRNKRPLVHCITNYVSANDCANALLAIGASPIMADDKNEAEDMTIKSFAKILERAKIITHESWPDN